ncbi:hypothetical protein N2152v2_004059 [Parachlorella kessleri]
MVKRKRKAPEPVAPAEEAAEPSQALEPSEGEAGEDEAGLTAYERERQRIIQRNRERLMALGIPTLVATLQKTAGASAAGARPKQRKKRPKQDGKAATTRQDAAPEELSLRRSSRLRQQHLTEQERLEAHVEQCTAAGMCPRCGEEVAADVARAHVEGCEGRSQMAPAELREGAPRVRRVDVEMTEEERRDARKRTLARMKQLSLENLVDFTEEHAQFVVLGSTGSHYTVTLADDKQTCQCMDYRFRRHQCKHICLALSHLGILDDPSGWHQAVEAKLEELMRVGAGDKDHPELQPPPGKKTEEALRYL